MRSAWAIFFVVAVLGGCAAKGAAAQDAQDASVDASSETGSRHAAIDASLLPETIVIVLEAGAEPGGPPRTAPAPIGGLPSPCEDTLKHLGTVTFSQSGTNVIITSSKTKARATCTRRDEHALQCDWVGMDGKPSLKQRTVSYGSKRNIGGSFDKSHVFSCKAQP